MISPLDPGPTLANDPAQAASAALTRAGLRAAQDALKANTYMVVAEDGKVQHVSPQDYLRMRQQPPAPAPSTTAKPVPSDC